MIGGRLGRNGVEGILRKVDQELPQHVACILRVSAGFAASPDDARLRRKTKHI